jgi:lantibiotic biosynthesis protein
MAGPRDLGLRADAGFMLRTPLLPFATLLDWAAAADVAAARRFLVDLLAQPAVDEAIFVASPSLHGSLDRWRRDPDSPAGQRTETAIVKYVARMAARATPFGLFSAVSAGRLGGATSLEVAPRAEYRRRTRLDNDYLFALIDALARDRDARARLRYRPNDSLYEVGGRLRYAEARLVGKDRSYHLVSVEPTPYLTATLARARTGARLADLAAGLTADDVDVSTDDAAAYLDELVEAQLLVPELGIAVTGPEPIDALIDQLAAAGLDEPRRILVEVRDAIAAIDAAGVGGPRERYAEVAAALEPLPAKVELSRLFQVDMVKPAAATLATKVVAEVARALDAIRRIARPPETSTLHDFRRAFNERYEGREVPLTEALDEETGIGFEADTGPGSEGSPLLAGLRFPGRPSQDRVAWGKVERVMARRLHAAVAAGADEIVLTDADLDAMASDAPPVPPDAVSSMIRLAGTPDQVARGDFTIAIESGAYGPSGARILGRFCHASPEIDAMVRAHLRAEEALRPDAVFAEIVHLNEGRIGNILCRPVLRDHEIVFLGVSGAPADRQLHVDDLMVSVRGDRVILRSRRLDKEVVPRMSTAHNFRLRSLGVYRFLCALQGQDGGGFGWSWGALAGAPFLPRVRYGKAILSRATWRLDEAELAPITAVVREMASKQAAAIPPSERRDRIAAAVAALRDRRGLPRFVVVAEGDNELVVDLDNPLMVQMLADDLAGASSSNLVELFPPVDALPVHGPDGAFTNEITLTFSRTREPTPALRPEAPARIRRSYGPGSSWLYAKLYTGVSTADRVLREAIAPVARGAIAGGDASHWFFIRYHDPGAHLRVRFAGEPARLLGGVMPALERAVAPLVDAGAIWKVQLDTYDREVERYGGDDGIELCEQLFWHDSEAVLEIVEAIEGDAGADARWRLALLGSESLVETLGLPPDAREKLFAEARDMIGAEHNANAAFYAQLGERYKRERAALDALLGRAPGHDLEPGIEMLARRDAAIAPIVDELRRRDAEGRLRPPLARFAWSLVHMHCNRLLHASQRTQELVIYDLLRRLHEGRRARSRRGAG